jgi:hypothetical protein
LPTRFCDPHPRDLDRAPASDARSAVAVASPARTSSTSCSTVKPCAIMIASRRSRRRAVRARGGGRAWGRDEGGEVEAWSSAGGGGLARQDTMWRPREHALDRANRKARRRQTCMALRGGDSPSEQARHHRACAILSALATRSHHALRLSAKRRPQARRTRGVCGGEREGCHRVTSARLDTRGNSPTNP